MFRCGILQWYFLLICVDVHIYEFCWSICWSSLHHWADICIVWRQGPDGQKGSRMKSTAMRSTWRGMGSIRLYFACDLPYNEKKQPCHTGSVAAWVNKDRTVCRTPGWRCQVCCWCIIEDSWKRQHHHRHVVHKDTKCCRETPGTYTWTGQVQMEHPWTLWNEVEELWWNNNRGRTQVTRFSSVEKRITLSIALDFLFSLWILSWDVTQSPAGSSPSALGQSLSTSQ